MIWNILYINSDFLKILIEYELLIQYNNNMLYPPSNARINIFRPADVFFNEWMNEWRNEWMNEWRNEKINVAC